MILQYVQEHIKLVNIKETKNYFLVKMKNTGDKKQKSQQFQS